MTTGEVASDNAYDVSGTLSDGVIVTDDEVLDRVCALGSLTIARGPALRLRRSDWAVHLAALANSRGMQVSIREKGRRVLVIDRGGWSPADQDVRHAEQSCRAASRAAHPSCSPRLTAVPEVPDT